MTHPIAESSTSDPVNVDRRGWYSIGINSVVRPASGSPAVDAELTQIVVDLFATGVLFAAHSGYYHLTDPVA